MLDRDQIVSGLKVRLLADLGLFLEGTQGVIQHVRSDDTSIWHAVVAWRCPLRKRRIQGRLTPQDLDFVEAVPQKRRPTLSQLSIPFPD
jgi:hypothetical protein